jgi:hypothetical protein
MSKPKKSVSVLMIFLILVLPIYSAQVLAVNVQINTNTGTAGVDGFIDAVGDTWTVQALVTNPPTDVQPGDLKLQIGSNQANFNSCTDDALGKLCKYESALTGGVKEGSHPFQVIYQPGGESQLASDSSIITADGSGPTISTVNAFQQEGVVLMTFTVTEDVEGSGVKKVEILNAKSSEILFTKEIPANTKTYTYSSADGKIELQGEGQQYVKVRAEDNLGHVSVSNVVSFSGDFVKPEIIEDSLEFPDLGKFIGEFEATSDITVSVKEKSLPIVSAVSEEAKIVSQAECEDDLKVIDLWHCTFNDVKIFSTGNVVSLQVTAQDVAGNQDVKTLSKTLSKDAKGPVVTYLGTAQTYNGKSYVKSGTNKLILVATDEGSGVDTETVRANIAGIGGSQSQFADECYQSTKETICVWKQSKTFNSDAIIRVGLTQFKDRAGNDGLLKEAELFSDVSNPKVQSIEIFGGDKTFFQSNDQLKINMKIAEENGLQVLVNLNDVVMDAETLYPATEISEDGWKIFTEEACTRQEGETTWSCKFVTDAIKSGPDTFTLEIDVRDTAGNSAEEWNKKPKNVDSGDKGNYKIRLLGLDSEANPNYWEQLSAVPLVKFIDLDTTKLTRTRIPFNVKFKSKKAKMLSLDVIECTPKGEGQGISKGSVIITEKNANSNISLTTKPSELKLSRTLILGKNFPGGDVSPTPTKLILEFMPFDGHKLFNIGDKEEFDKAEVEFTCQFRLFSQVGNSALKAAEIQEIDLKVPFAFSKLGAVDENIEGTIKDIKDDIWFKIPDRLAVVNDVLKIVRSIGPIIAILQTLNVWYNLANGSFDKVRAGLPVYGPIIATGECGAIVAAKEPLWEGFEVLQVPLQVLTCSPSPAPTTWYGKYQKKVLHTLNLYKNAGMRQDVSLYDNIYLSSVSLCVPGVIHNLEKWRQIQCIHIDCLQNQVGNGAATVNSCETINDILTCKYVTGELVGMFIPMTGLTKAVKDMIKAALTNPVGLVRAALTRGCSLSCPVSNQGATFCDYAGIGVMAVDVIENVIGIYQSYPSISQDYCSNIGETGTSFLS